MKTYISTVVFPLIFGFNIVVLGATLSYTAIDLGNPISDPEDSITLTDMNSSGAITGYSFHGADSSTKGLVWSSGSVTNLNSLGGIFTSSTSTRAYSVNNQGQVVGSYSSTSLPGVNRSFVLQNGTGTDLLTTGIGPSNGSIAYSINNNGIIVGSASVNLGGNFYLENGTMTTLPCLPGEARAFATDINDNNITVGRSLLSGVLTAVMWQNGAVSSLGILGSYSDPIAINNRGEIIGASNLGNFLWKDGVVTYFTESDLRDLNNLGQIIAGNRIYQDGTYSDIEIVSGSDLTGGSFSPQVINDLGQIAGIGSNGHVFLLTPIPEPSGIAMLLISTLTVMTRRRK